MIYSLNETTNHNDNNRQDLEVMKKELWFMNVLLFVADDMKFRISSVCNNCTEEERWIQHTMKSLMQPKRKDLEATTTKTKQKGSQTSVLFFSLQICKQTEEYGTW